MRSGFAGMLFVFSLVASAMFLGGSEAFFNLPSLAICIGMPIGLSLASAGAADTGRALRALRCLFVSCRDVDVMARNSQVLRHMISYSYAAGIVGTMIGWIQMLRHTTDLSVVPFGLSLSILTLFYAIIISECVLRPATRRIDSRCITTTGERRPTSLTCP